MKYPDNKNLPKPALIDYLVVSLAGIVFWILVILWN